MFQSSKQPVLFMALVSFFLLASQLSAAANSSATPHIWRDIHVTAKQFQFSPRQISVKKGETVRLNITSKDVLHGFRIVPLGIKVAVRPGETAEVFLTPTRAGRLVATCSEFCGNGHKKMELTINVKP
jgi:cytochrome c oxidase subunit II